MDDKKLIPGQLRKWNDMPDAEASAHFLVIQKRESEIDDAGWYILEGEVLDWEWEKIILNYSSVVDVTN